MICDFGDKRTAQFHVGEQVKAFGGFDCAARAKLDRLDIANSLEDLSALPGNRLETPKGDREGQYSIRINSQWRICFTWAKGKTSPSQVEIVDYH